ncbi:MAG: translation initiation factor IF-2 [Thermotoga sp.]|nr:MAG: translation initiation factor IF-2 [Thermotoga sp.]HDM70722.1 translation initiation factor IF-2 [Thermotogales bacterium]
MGRLRVYELAKLLGMSSKELLNELEELGIDAKNHMSILDESTVNVLLELYSEEEENVKVKKGKPKKKDVEKMEELMEEEEREKKSRKSIVITSDKMVLKDFAKLLNLPVSKIIQDAFMKGIILNPNQELNYEKMKEIAHNYGCKIERKGEETKVEIEDPLKKLEEYYENLYLEKEDELTYRPPVVTVMGHVDHGKTTLLDRIRKTRVAEKEEGGITQSIGAYQVVYNGKKITFIDTPGHESFTEMRARGAQATDIVILVVAADDSVMPQTIEAYNHAKNAGVPIIVAINKIDKPNANVEKTKQDLVSKLGLVPEEWGGDTIVVPISARTGEGVDELLDMVLLVAEMNEIKCYPKGRARGVIIESRMDKSRGPVASVIIKDGILKPRDYFVTGNTFGRVKAILDENGRNKKEAHPSDPVLILGFEELPDMHSMLYVVESLNEAKRIVETVKEREKRAERKHISLEELFERMQKEGTKVLKLILKAETQGSLEAVRRTVERMRVEEIDIEVIHAGIGSITLSDVMLADAADAVIIGFRVKPDAKAIAEAEKEKIQIRTYTVIFDLVEDLKKALQGMLEPEIVEEYTGKGVIKKVFNIGKVGKVAGVQLLEGYVTRDSKIRIYRNNEEIYEGKLESLKHYKNDVSRMDAPQECGMKFEKFEDFKEEDELRFYTVKKVQKELKFISQEKGGD